jgi:LPS O-antigen subunit length determinant protein (WzzB/FepE family)
MSDKPEPQASGPSKPPPRDEIELADVAKVIYRRRWMMVACIALVSVVAAVYSFTLPRVYEYRAVLEIGELPAYEYPVVLEMGKLPVADRSRHFIESPENVASRIKQLARGGGTKNESDANTAGPDSTVIGNVAVSTAEDTGLVDIVLRTSESVGSSHRLIKLLEKIVVDHDKLVEDEIQVRTRDLEKAETELLWLEMEPKYVRQQISALDDRQRQVEAYLERAEGRREKLHDLQATLISQNPADDPVPVLLITTEIDNLERRVEELQRELSIDIPERRRILRGELHKLDLRFSTARQGITEATQTLGEITPTRIVDVLTSAGEPASPNYLLNIALGLVLGAFLSLFLVFLVEFWVHNKHKIVSE